MGLWKSKKRRPPPKANSPPSECFVENIPSYDYADQDYPFEAYSYFFESDMLINLNIENCVEKGIPIPARYSDEESSLKIGKILATFPFCLLKGLCKRILFNCFIYDFNMASIYMLVGILMVLFGVFFRAYR